MLKTGAFRHLQSPPFTCYLYTTGAHQPALNMRTWMEAPFLQIKAAFFGLNSVRSPRQELASSMRCTTPEEIFPVLK